MAMIGFVMIAASGFANVINTTSGVKELVDALSTGAIQSKGLAAFLMLLVGLLITIGNWFIILNCTNHCFYLRATLFIFWFLTISHRFYRWCCGSLRRRRLPCL